LPVIQNHPNRAGAHLGTKRRSSLRHGSSLSRVGASDKLGAVQFLAKQRLNSRLHIRSEDAQSSSVASIDSPVIHDLRIMETHGFRSQQKAQL
ncbi:hypothetical protein, partial [Aurantimonas aggregata]|uniref:hypothetical protein n=1 Tax=Aurantimonas aggregata TaxID=2047720 RepID=UPI001940A742